jgi:phosphatidylinositol alpha-1,6-mannosyltransferase
LRGGAATLARPGARVEEGSRVIVGLFPELLSVGGVQRAGRHIAAVLTKFADETRQPVRLLSLKDPHGANEFRLGGQRVPFWGAGGSKIRFVAEALRERGEARVVLAAHPNLAPVAWALKAGSGRARAAVFAHGIEVWEPLPMLRRRALRRMDLVFAPSVDTAEKVVQKQGVLPAKVRQLAWGLDPEFFAATKNNPAPRPRSFPPGRVVLAVARLAASERYKGIDELIQILPRLAPAVPDLHLVIVGDGDDRARLEHVAASAGVRDRAVFLGVLEREDLIACYRHADVFALPSSGEGFGLVFLEAMALGKAVVGGAHGGTPDVIEDGVTGFLVRQEDTERLAELLRRLLTDEVLRCRLGSEAREFVERNFLFEHFRARLESAIEHLSVR